MDGTSKEEVTRQVFRERDVPTRAGFNLWSPFYSGGLRWRQDCIIGGVIGDAVWGGPTKIGLPSQSGVGSGDRGEGWTYSINSLVL